MVTLVLLELLLEPAQGAFQVEAGACRVRWQRATGRTSVGCRGRRNRPRWLGPSDPRLRRGNWRRRRLPQLPMERRAVGEGEALPQPPASEVTDPSVTSMGLQSH